MLSLNKIVLKCYHRSLSVTFINHLIISFILRLCLIVYGEWQDTISEVPFTDIDYKVVTDGARHILIGHSPFNRHTYRYSPILAYIHICNILLHPTFAKIIYSIFDILVAILIYNLVRKELKLQCFKAVEALSKIYPKQLAIKLSARKANTNINANANLYCDVHNQPERLALISACFWLYNPLTGIISTRGNGDSVSSFFVILTLYLLMRSEDMAKTNHRYMCILAGGLLHGFTIHLRLYPVLFSLPYFIVLAEPYTAPNFMRRLLQIFFRPSLKQFILMMATLTSLSITTGLFYKMYGWKYIEESYLYHMARKDVRHNFSVYFLMQYLSTGHKHTSYLIKFLTIAPQFILIIYLSFSFGQYRQTLPFAIFTIAFVLVTYNSVVTSQYFIWYMALLSLCLNNLQTIQWKYAVAYFTIWLLGQALWLLPAYLLEFKTWNTFNWLGIQCAIYFIINNLILERLIQHYTFTIFKINLNKIF